MMSAAPLATTDDPTLAALIPQPSRARNLVVVAAALVALVLAACAGASIRLDMRPRGSAAQLLPGGQIAYATSFDGRVFPGTRVTALRPPDGTAVDAVWVLGPDDPDPLAGSSDLASAVATMHASGSPTGLPQGVPAEGLRLLVLLSVENCAALVDDAPTPVVQYPAVLEIRSLLGSVNQVDLDSWPWPREELEKVGACQ